MKKIILDQKNADKYLDMIPSDYVEHIFSEDTICMGMEYLDIPSGVIICRCKDDNKPAKLLSIYVKPEARRLGIGTALFLALVKELAHRKKESLTFRFQESGDRVSLVPFLTEMGCDADVFGVPVGTVSLSEAEEKINRVFEGAEEKGSAIDDLSNADKNIVIKLLGRTADIHTMDYLSGKPESFVIMKDGIIRATLMFSEENEKLLNLDYAYACEPVEFAMILKCAVKRLREAYPSDTVIEMLLMNDSSRGLYGRLFGETEEYIDIAEGELKLANSGN